MNKKMLIALGASVCLSTAAFAADNMSSTPENSTSTPLVAPATPRPDAMPTKPTEQEVNKAASGDKHAEGKCSAGTCAAGKCSGAPKK